ncbi:MAG: recombinase family protein, partial [Lachnospiraceae bacterium]|nr:recombinase family protein [Lachnospiraceae bacterium]
FEKGQVIVNHNKFMGYTKNDKDELVIVPEEAEVVRLIFRLYLEGYSTAKISGYLEEKGIKTATGKDKWNATVIAKMIRNEKYMGDALLQKTYTVDFMTKKKVPNNGIVPQYYVEDDHEAIIPKELFFRVQEEIMRRSAMSGTCQIPEFDNDLVRRLIAGIRVISADRIEIQFQSGIVMEQEIVNE